MRKKGALASEEWVKLQTKPHRDTPRPLARPRSNRMTMTMSLYGLSHLYPPLPSPRAGRAGRTLNGRPHGGDGRRKSGKLTGRLVSSPVPLRPSLLPLQRRHARTAGQRRHG